MVDDKLLLENLTPASIHQIAWEIREKTHDPHDARRLLYKYCELFDKRESIPLELERYLRDGFEKYLSGGTDLDTALGLTKGKRRSGVDDWTAARISVDIWKERLEGKAHQEAVENAVQKYGWEKTKIGEVWSANRIDALVQLKVERKLEGTDLTDEEVESATRILKPDMDKIASLFGQSLRDSEK